MNNDTQTQKDTVSRKTYQTPHLCCLGKITNITTGGSGMMQEMGMMIAPGDQPTRFP